VNKDFQISIYCSSGRCQVCCKMASKELQTENPKYS